jgi:hypothetical protein
MGGRGGGTCCRRGLRKLWCTCAAAKAAAGAAGTRACENVVQAKRTTWQRESVFRVQGLGLNLRVVHDVEHVELEVGVALRSRRHTVTRHIHPANKAAVFGPANVIVMMRRRLRARVCVLCMCGGGMGGGGGGGAHYCRCCAVAAAYVDDDIVGDYVRPCGVAEGVGCFAEYENASTGSIVGVQDGGRGWGLRGKCVGRRCACWGRVEVDGGWETGSWHGHGEGMMQLRSTRLALHKNEK